MLAKTLPSKTNNPTQSGFNPRPTKPNPTQPMSTTEDRNTTHAAVTRAFFRLTTAQVERELLANIATHYGISPDEAFDEVTNDDAEDLLDYITGDARNAAYVLMQRHGLR